MNRTVHRRALIRSAGAPRMWEVGDASLSVRRSDGRGHTDSRPPIQGDIVSLTTTETATTKASRKGESK